MIYCVLIYIIYISDYINSDLKKKKVLLVFETFEKY